MEGATGMDISTFTGVVTELAETATTMATSVMTTVTASPIIMTFVALPLVGLGIGFVKRLLRIGR